MLSYTIKNIIIVSIVAMLSNNAVLFSARSIPILSIRTANKDIA